MPLNFIKNILRLQIFRFLIAGLFCACLEYLLFNLFISLVRLNYLIANVIAIMIAMTINYILSKIYIFGKSKYSKLNELISFVFFSVLAIILNQLVLWIFVEFIQLDIRLCKALTIIIVAFFNFTTKKYIVFKGS